MSIGKEAGGGGGAIKRLEKKKKSEPPRGPFFLRITPGVIMKSRERLGQMRGVKVLDRRTLNQTGFSENKTSRHQNVLALKNRQGGGRNKC